MKKLNTTILLCLALISSTGTLADNHLYGNHGGYAGPGSTVTITTVTKAKQLYDDTHVRLQGNIVKSLGGEMYLFQDKTGSIPVEIDHDEWYGIQVGTDTKVEIYGEVAREWHGTKIDVDRIMVLPN